MSTSAKHRPDGQARWYLPPGYWMGQFFVVGQMPVNLPAQAFWRHTISDCTNGNYVEHELHDDRWDGLIQCFDNTAIQTAGS